MRDIAAVWGRGAPPAFPCDVPRAAAWVAGIAKRSCLDGIVSRGSTIRPLAPRCAAGGGVLRP